jgi:hypothetical protein
MPTMRLADEHAEKAAGFPESSYGVTTVTLVLGDGRRITNVRLAWGAAIIGISDSVVNAPAQLDFDIAAVRDVEPE